MKYYQLPEKYLNNSTVSEIFCHISEILKQGLGMENELNIDNIPIRAEFLDMKADEDFFTSSQSPTYTALHSYKSINGIVLMEDKTYKPLNIKYLLSANFTRQYDGSIQMNGELTYEIDGFTQEYLNIERNSYDGFDIAA
jgi:hypothetical protein